MKIINIIEIENNIVKDIISLGIYKEQLSSEVIDKAEELFEKKIIEMFVDITEEQIENAKIDGYFEINNQSVCLVWSYI